MKNWKQGVKLEAAIKRKVQEQRVLSFLVGGSIKFQNQEVRLHWTDHGSLLMAHNSRDIKRHQIVGVSGPPSALGMLTVVRDVIMSMLSRFDGKFIDGSKSPGKILWFAPKADMSQIFRKATFSINDNLIPVREASDFVSIDLLSEMLAKTTVVFLRDSWRLKEALTSHSFESVVIDDPFGLDFCSSKSSTDILNNILALDNVPPIFAVLPVRALPNSEKLLHNKLITIWPWTADLTDSTESNRSYIEENLDGSIINRSQITFDFNSQFPATVIECSSNNNLIEITMKEIWEIYLHLGNQFECVKTTVERRLLNEARRTILIIESLCMPLSIHEAILSPTHSGRVGTIFERLNVISKSLFLCNSAIHDDLSILLDRIDQLLGLMIREVPKWRVVVSLLKNAVLEGKETAIVLPNLHSQEAFLKALKVQFPEYKDNLPWHVCTTSMVPRLGGVDEIIFSGIPSLKQNWLLRYPTCLDRKILTWPFNRKLGVWLASPCLIAGIEQQRITSWESISHISVDKIPEASWRELPRVTVIEGESKLKTYYDIPQGDYVVPFVWNNLHSEDNEDEQDEQEQEQIDGLSYSRDAQNINVTEHLIIHVENDGLIYALNDDRFDVIKGNTVYDSAALSLTSGQEIILIRGQSYIKLRNSLMEGIDRRYSGIWFEDDWNRWRQMCRSIPTTGPAFANFVIKLRDLGCDKEDITIRYWLNGVSLAPLDAKDIRRVSLAAGDDMMVYYSYRFAQGMRELRSRHTAFGKWLKRVTLAKSRVNDNEIIDPVLDFTVSDLKGSVSKHKIIKIEMVNGPPEYRTGEVIIAR
ncbi:MAG: DrmE family protein [Bacillota bacterium]